MILERGDGIQQRIAGNRGEIPSGVVGDRGDGRAAVAEENAGIDADGVVFTPAEKSGGVDPDDILIVGEAAVVCGPAWYRCCRLDSGW